MLLNEILNNPLLEVMHYLQPQQYAHLTRENINYFGAVIKEQKQVCAKFKDLLISVIFVSLY